MAYTIAIVNAAVPLLIRAVLLAGNHLSRKIVWVAPRERPNAGWIIEVLEQAMRKHGGPKHIISDQAPVFAAAAFAELLKGWNIKPRFGVIGKHGSIAVTERVIDFVEARRSDGCLTDAHGFSHDSKTLCSAGKATTGAAAEPLYCPYPYVYAVRPDEQWRPATPYPAGPTSHPFRPPSCGGFCRLKAISHPLDRRRPARMHQLFLGQKRMA